MLQMMISRKLSKDRQFVDANELSRTAKKPAIRSSPNVNYQTIVDAVSEVMDQRDRNRTAEVNMVQNANCATAIIGIERRRLVRARQHLVIHRQEVRPAVRQRRRAQFVSRTRLSPGQVTKVTLHQEEVVRKVTSLRKGMEIANGHGQVNARTKTPFTSTPFTKSKWPSTCAVTVGKTVGGRSRCPAFASTGSTQHRELEARLKIAYWRW